MIFLLIGLAAIALAAFVLELKRNERFDDLVNFLLFGAVSTIFLMVMREEDKVFFWAVLSVVALNFALSHVRLFRKEYVRALLPLISVIVFSMLLKDRVYHFIDEQGILVNKFLVTSLVLAVLGYEIGKLKTGMINKFLGHLDEKETLRALLLFFTGVAVFLGGFESGSIGLLILAGIYLSGSFYRDGESKGIFISLIAFALLSFFMLRAGETGSDILDGDVIAGLFLGGFAVYFLQKLFDAEKRNTLMIVLVYGIVIAISFGLLYLRVIYARMGGMDAYVGLLIGFALTQALVGKRNVGAGLLSVFLIGGLVLPRYMVNESESESEIVLETEGQNGETMDPVSISLTEITGDYILVTDASKVSFFLGKKDETKGAFKKVSGTIKIEEDLTKSTFDITMKMADFTTFNEYRDESLLSTDYFSADKYPVMTFKSDKLVDKGDGVWEIVGKFSMLGVTKELPVTVKCVEVNGKKLLNGTGKIDRTQFGMSPSTEEGNIVTFEYQVELKAE